MKHFPPNRSCNLLVLLLSISIFSFSCNQNKKTAATQTNLTSADSATTAPTTVSVDTTLLHLESFKGEYPSDVKFLDQPDLKSRLEALLGAQYANFRKYWQTETPIVVEDHVLSTTGCEQHNCAANQFVLQIDLMHNNINVYHFGEGIQSYLEKGPISLPDSLAKEFKILTQNNGPQSI